MKRVGGLGGGGSGWEREWQKGYQDSQYIFFISNIIQYDRIVEMALVQGHSCFGKKAYITFDNHGDGVTMKKELVYTSHELSTENLS